MAEHESAPDDLLPPKTFSCGAGVVLGDVDLTYSITSSGTDATDAMKYMRMLNNIIEQALSFIQHALEPDHPKADCLAQAFKQPDQGEMVSQQEDAKLAQMLATAKNLPTS